MEHQRATPPSFSQATSGSLMQQRWSTSHARPTPALNIRTGDSYTHALAYPASFATAHAETQEILSAEVQAIVRRLVSEGARQDERFWDFTVGICDASFRVLNCVKLHGHERVRGLQQELQLLGYQPVSLGTTQQLCGCDLLLVPDCSRKQ